MDNEDKKELIKSSNKSQKVYVEIELDKESDKNPSEHISKKLKELEVITSDIMNKKNFIKFSTRVNSLDKIKEIVKEIRNIDGVRDVEARTLTPID